MNTYSLTEPAYLLQDTDPVTAELTSPVLMVCVDCLREALHLTDDVDISDAVINEYRAHVLVERADIAGYTHPPQCDSCHSVLAHTGRYVG